MRYDAIIFDFDGTLVDSQRAKHAAFFALFPRTAEHEAVIGAVLDAFPEASRYTVIPKIVEALDREGLALPQATAEALAEDYSARVLVAVAQCPELPEATTLLKTLSLRSRLFVSSNTPETALQRLVAGRGWSMFVHGVYGYPRRKSDTIAEIMARYALKPSQIAVVGDGDSDAEAAGANGCAFYSVRPPKYLAGLSRELEVSGV